MISDPFSQWLSQEAASCVSSETHVLAVGDQVGAWTIRAYLSHGGTAEVYRAEHRSTRQIGALKIARHPENPECAARFAREAELLLQLKGGGYAQLLDQGRHGQRPWIVLGLLRPLDLPDQDDSVAACVLRVAQALDRLHRTGYVHRDIKPTNLLTDDGTTPILVDLGYAKKFSTEPAVPDVDSISIERTQSLGVGTPGYAAPEQFMDGAVTPATDIHALGVLIDSCFNGHPPACWQAIIRRCTSSLPQQRYASAAEFIRAVRMRHSGHPVRRVCGLLATALLVGSLAYAGVVAAFHHNQNIKSQVFVQADAPSGGDGTADRPFNTITNALVAVPWFGTVHVRPGRYVEDIEIIDKSIVLAADRGPEQTTLVGLRESSVVMIGWRAAGTTVEGFTITGGFGYPLPSRLDESMSRAYDHSGGGISCFVPATIRNCRIVGNGRGKDRDASATVGGGIYVATGNVTVVGCVLSNNFAWAMGGGAAVVGPGAFLNLVNCTVVDNDSEDYLGRQGGLAVGYYGSASLKNCRFSRNKGRQIDACGGDYAEGTRISAADCQIEGGLRRGNFDKFDADACSMRGLTER